MTEFVLDLSKPTWHYEVSVWHYSDDHYSVDQDRGHGRVTVWETDNRDKAIGVAEYLEQNGRISYDDGKPIENIGEPFTGAIVHWDCGDVDHGQDDDATTERGTGMSHPEDLLRQMFTRRAGPSPGNARAHHRTETRPGQRPAARSRCDAGRRGGQHGRRRI